MRRLVNRLSRGRFYDWSKPFRDHEHGIDIRGKAGDAIIWDLRIAHRASPKRANGAASNGGKLSVCFNCGANNAITTEVYMNYVTSIPENEFLRKKRSVPARVEVDATREFVIR